MCTLVCRWDPDAAFPVQILALRDERSRRPFDLPGPWWPEAPGVVGGRDRQAGGSWCVSDVAAGVTAIVLNRPDRPVPTHAGAASRGVLPLLAIKWGSDWPKHIAVDEMATFNLVLVDQGELHWWSFDGAQLHDGALDPGNYLFKPRGRVIDEIDPRLRSGQAGLHSPDDLDAPTEAVWGEWFVALAEATPRADGVGLLARRILDDGETYQTVFAQFIAARPGLMRLDYLIDPAAGGAWTTRIST